MVYLFFQAEKDNKWGKLVRVDQQKNARQPHKALLSHHFHIVKQLPFHFAPQQIQEWNKTGRILSHLISICSLQIRAWVPCGLHAVRKNLLLIVTLLHHWDLVFHSVYDPAWEVTEGALHYLSELSGQTIPVLMKISLSIKTIHQTYPK